MIYNEDHRGSGEMKLLIKATRNAATSSNLDHQLPVLKRRNKGNPITKKHAELRTRLESKRARTYGGPPRNWRFYTGIVKKYLSPSKRSKKYFHLQIQISILLFAHSLENRGICTHRPTEAAQEYPGILPGPNVDIFDEVMNLEEIFNGMYTYGISTADFDLIEESLVSTISFLHSKGISYPVPDVYQLYFIYSCPNKERNKGKVTLRLLLGPNKSASMISSSNDSSSALDNEIKQARSIFYYPKLILKLCNSTTQITLGASDQDFLLENFKREDNICHDFVDLCKDKIGNKMIQLTRFVSWNSCWRNGGHHCRKVIDDFFLWHNNDSTLSLPCKSCRCSPLTVCAFYRRILKQGYQDIVDNEIICHCGPIESLKELQDEEDSRTTISNTNLIYIICIRAYASSSLTKDLNERRQWYTMGKLLYTTFLSHIIPESKLEKFFAGDCDGWLDERVVED